MLTPADIKKFYLLLVLGLFPLYLFCQHDHVFALQNKADTRIGFDTTINDNTQLEPFESQMTISGLAFSGEITLYSDSSLVRIILMDNNYNEYLIYETYPILSCLGQFSFDQAGEETSLLNNITPIRVSIELVDATLYLKDFIISEKDAYQAATKSALSLQQSKYKIDRINRNIQDLDQTWVAGETSISKLSYQEKKSMFGGNVPNFQGFEYYVGGVFVLPGAWVEDSDAKDITSKNLSQQESQYVSEFSWKNRHGEDWTTPVKKQGCNDCWVFGATAATELLVNLYFNRHLDYDLSEQNLISCTSWTCNSGGSQKDAYDYIRDTGIVMEDCFPYTASDQDCSEMCGNPQERIKIDHTKFFYDEEDKKRAIINGATSAKINSWKHVVQINGYKVLEEGENLFVKNDADTSRWITIENNNPLIGQTAWLCKNSWGDEWGNNGYVYLIGDQNDILLYSLSGPVSSLIFNDDYVICTDNDGDGYYCWGIGPKPSHCPECPDEQDGDDSDPCIGPMDEYGNFKSTTQTPDAKDTLVLYGQLVPDLSATGSNIRWYRDEKLLNLVHIGNVFTTGQTEIGDYTYYVTQTLSGCESDANAVSLSIWLEIPRPLGHDTFICVGEPAILTVEGEQGATFKWYEDPLLTILLHTGDSYETQKTDIGTYTYYVTQSLCLLESAPDTVLLKIEPVVTIPDSAFLHALIEQGVDSSGDGLITYSEAEAISHLDVSWHGIADMAGIEAFVNLENLDCSVNQLTSLDVSGNPKLKYLDCSGWWHSKIAPLTTLKVSNNTELEFLDCGSSLLSSLDITNNKALKYLNCDYTQLAGLDLLNNHSLAYLVCSYNQFTTLDVSHNRALKELNCSVNKLDDLDVTGNISLEVLDCSSNALTYLDVYKNLFLRDLSCGGNQLNYLDIRNNTNIEQLSFCGMKSLVLVCVWWNTIFPPDGVWISGCFPSPVIMSECGSLGNDCYMQPGLTVFPNPVSDILTIQIGSLGRYKLNLSTPNGQLIYNSAMEGTTHQIDLSTLQKGVYFITIRSKDFVTTKKIIKL